MKNLSAKTFNPLTILVLDDMPSWRQTVKSLLESDLGVSPLVAASGQEALDILESRPVDVVISDLNMPQMSGIEFLKEARSRFPRTKVIMMSADSVSCKALADEFFILGAFAVVCKVEIEPNLVNLMRFFPSATLNRTNLH